MSGAVQPEDGGAAPDLAAEWRKVTGPAVAGADGSVNGGGGAADDGAPAPVETPMAIEQFNVFVRREMRLLWRQRYTALSDLCLVCLGAAVLGASHTNLPLREVDSMATLNTIVVGLTTAVPALRTFGANRHTYWREASAGVHRVAYCVAVMVAMLPMMVASAAVHTVITQTLMVLRTPTILMFCLVLGAMWAATGLGHLVSSVFGPHTSQLAVVVLVLVSTILCGGAPRAASCPPALPPR